MLGAWGCDAGPAVAPDAPLAVDATVDAPPFDSQGCTNLAFTEVIPEHTSVELRAEIEAALQHLCASDTDRDVGYLTYESIARGLVKVDRHEDMTDLDYRTALVFSGLDADEVRARRRSTRSSAACTVPPLDRANDLVYFPCE